MINVLYGGGGGVLEEKIFDFIIKTVPYDSILEKKEEPSITNIEYYGTTTISHRLTTKKK